MLIKSVTNRRTDSTLSRVGLCDMLTVVNLWLCAVLPGDAADGPLMAAVVLELGQRPHGEALHAARVLQVAAVRYRKVLSYYSHLK